jgi:glycosyltransferase involved in cell wall biosynthesis
LVALDYPLAGGGIARLLKALVEHSADVLEWRVATTSPGPRDPSTRRAATTTELIAGLRKDLRWAQSVPGSRVICGHPYLSLPVLAAARSTGTPASALVYGREVLRQKPHHDLLLTGLRGYERVLSISESTAALLPALSVQASRVRVVHPEFPTPLLPSRRRQRGDGDGLRLAAVSRLSERYKNIDLLIATLLVLRDTGAVEKFTIVGDGRDRVGYEREASRAGLGDIVTFAGSLSDEQALGVLHSSDLGVFPSRSSSAEGGLEGFGLVVQEMAAAGLPVLVGDAAGAREAAHPDWSLLLDPEDVFLWATTLRQLQREPQRLTELQSGAHAWAEKLDPARTVQDMINGLSP